MSHTIYAGKFEQTIIHQQVQVWKGTTQGIPQPSVLEFGAVVSDEKI
jgi:hypothetical protein